MMVRRRVVPPAKRHEYYAKNTEKIKAATKANVLRHKDLEGPLYWRAHKLRHLYGMTLFDFGRRLEQQRYACARCFKPFVAVRAHVDHDHATGRVRGLLCQACNLKVLKAEEIALTAGYLARTAA